MTNRTHICYNHECKKKTLTPIYYRDTNRVYKVAFYVCLSCSQFFEFIDWKTHRKIPFYNDMLGLVTVRLVKQLNDTEKDPLDRKNKVFLMQKNDSPSCIQCLKTDISKLYLRKRPRQLFIGYVCKNCRTIYLVNRDNFKIRALDPNRYLRHDSTQKERIYAEELVGQFPVAIGKPINTKYVELHLKLPVEQIEQIKEYMKKEKIPIPR